MYTTMKLGLAALHQVIQLPHTEQRKVRSVVPSTSSSHTVSPSPNLT